MRIFAFALLFSLIGITFSVSVFAEELILEFDPDEELTIEDLRKSEVQQEDVNESLTSVSQPISLRDQYIEGYQQLFLWGRDEIAGLEAMLKPLDNELYSIDSQLQILALQVKRMEEQEFLIRKKMRGLEELENKFRIQEELFALEMKDVLQDFEHVLILFFRVKRQYMMEDGTVNVLQLFFSASSPSELLFQDYLLEKIQTQLVDQIELVYAQQLQLDELSKKLDVTRTQYTLYQEQLGESVQVLSQQAKYQQELLAEKQEARQFFDEQLQIAQQEQLDIMLRIQELAGIISPLAYDHFPRESFIWPVVPVLGISSRFRDAAYQVRFGIVHNAVDIPTDQLTPVRAALSGKVVKLHDGGQNGYSYLQLAHRDGFTTVYGHLYSFRVRDGEEVQQGQIIAMSGGALGTRGAGRITTGPHLHFEVLKDGEYVDPMRYLGEVSP